MQHLLKTLCLLLICAHSLSAAAHVWTSTSGSEIEATYLGSFGDDLWFEGTTAQRRLLKMPAKYISSTDRSLIETNEIAPRIAPQAIDDADTSLWLLEQLFKIPVPKPLDSTLTLEDALNNLLNTIPQGEDTELRIKFHRKVNQDATGIDPINGPTIYACLQQLADAHEFTWSIRKGVLTLRPR